jgi:PIN domain nuclease of toxin-antitoxin system
MIVAVADTHTIIWYLFNDERLSNIARQTIETAAVDGNQIGIASITIAEIVYLSKKKPYSRTDIGTFAKCNR